MAQEETGDLEGAASGPQRRSTSPEAAWDPEQWWSFGEAADRAGVTHRTLQGWAERGEVMVRTAWREGTEFRLVRAGDVARLAPEADGLVGESAPLEQRALFTGPRRSALGAGAPPSPLSPAGAQPARYDDDRDAFRRTAELEIVRLREELSSLRRRGDAGSSRAAASPAPMDLWSIEEPRRAGLQGGRPWGPRRLAVFLAGLTLGLSVGVAWERGSLADREPLDAAQGEPAGTPVSLAGLTGRDGLAGPDGLAGSGGSAGAAEAAGPAGPSSASAPGDPTPGDPTPGDSVAGTAEPAVAGPIRAASVAAITAPKLEKVAPGPEVALPLGLGAWLEGGRGVSFSSLDGASTCAFGSGDLATPASRFVLGSCWGELAPGGATVLATDRVEGVACCKHHAAVQRLKGVASTPRALEVAMKEAEQAVRDGLLPPMLELRADRSGLLLARALTGGWRASGFDGPVAERTHVWRLADGPEGTPDGVGARLELHSWVERGLDGAYVPFRLVLELGGSTSGDRALEFQWLE